MHHSGLTANQLNGPLTLVEHLINSTPSGDDRNALTEANRHLMTAQNILAHLALGKEGKPPSIIGLDINEGG